MEANEFYLGDVFTSIVERLESLNEQIESDEISLETYEQEKESLRKEIRGGEGALLDMIFESLSEIARDENDVLAISTDDLIRHEIEAGELDEFLQANECLGFLLLADSANLAEFVVKLNENGWNIENVYLLNRFRGVYFEWDA